MLNAVRLLFSALFTASVLMLSSCIDVKEEIWINEDSSSKISMDITIPASGKRTLEKSLSGLKKVADQTKGASMETSEIEITQDRRVNSKFSLEFSSILAAKRFSENLPKSSGDGPESPASSLIGEFSLNIDQMAAKIDRKVFTTKLLPLKNTNDRVAELNRKRLNGASLEYILHLPNAPLSSNAMSSHDDGRTLRWSFLLADHLNEDANIQFTWRPKVAWWLWLTFLFLIILVSFVIFKIIKFLKKQLQGSRRNITQTVIE